MEITGREVWTVRQMVQYIPLEFFQKRSGDMRGMGLRVVVEQAHIFFTLIFLSQLNELWS
jgi:hypothetical protein